jgi:hypothetical protein
MIFWASAEVHKSADAMLEVCRNHFESAMNDALTISNLVDFDIKVRYVPIVMPADMKMRYPARTKVLKSKRIFDCAPQLDYEIFVGTNFASALREYANGILGESHLLRELGLSESQLAEFVRIVEETEAAAIVEHGRAL